MCTPTSLFLSLRIIGAFASYCTMLFLVDDVKPRRKNDIMHLAPFKILCLCCLVRCEAQTRGSPTRTSAQRLGADEKKDSLRLTPISPVRIRNRIFLEETPTPQGNTSRSKKHCKGREEKKSGPGRPNQHLEARHPRSSPDRMNHNPPPSPVIELSGNVLLTASC